MRFGVCMGMGMGMGMNVGLWPSIVVVRVCATCLRIEVLGNST